MSLPVITSEDDDSSFDEQFLLQDNEGNPIAFQKYKISTSDGQVYRGMTDKDGKTQRIKTPSAEELVFEYDIDDME